MIDWISLIQTLGGIVGGLGLGYFTKSGRVKSQADAYKAMAEAYEYRINALHEVVTKSNETEKMHAQRISELNAALNRKEDEMRQIREDKDAQIRKLTAELLASERKANEINDKLTDAQNALIEKESLIGDLRVAAEYLLEWRCEHSQCNDPRGRRPPNGKLQGKKFEMPKIIAYIKKRK